MSDTPSGLRERNRAERLQRIRAVALEAFSTRGFDDVTVDEIADLAAVSKSTLFRYFPTKEDLLVADDAARLDTIRSVFVDRPGDEPVVESLRAALVALAADYQDDATDHLQRFRVIRATPALSARVLEQQTAREDALAAAIATRLGPGAANETRARLLAGAGMAVIRVAMRDWLTGSRGQDLTVLVTRSLDELAGQFQQG